MGLITQVSIITYVVMINVAQNVVPTNQPQLWFSPNLAIYFVRGLPSSVEHGIEAIWNPVLN